MPPARLFQAQPPLQKIRYRKLLFEGLNPNIDAVEQTREIPIAS